MYPENVVLPLKQELTNVGFEDCITAESIDQAISKSGTTLVVINSVCGCAARNARPAVIQSLSGGKKPTNLATVFAGFDTEAVAQARQQMLPFPPSSPSIGLFKDGQLVHMIERHNIEGNTAEEISENLVQAYEQHCC